MATHTVHTPHAHIHSTLTQHALKPPDSHTIHTPTFLIYKYAFYLPKNLPQELHTFPWQHFKFSFRTVFPDVCVIMGQGLEFMFINCISERVKERFAREQERITLSRFCSQKLSNLLKKPMSEFPTLLISGQLSKLPVPS